MQRTPVLNRQTFPHLLDHIRKIKYFKHCTHDIQFTNPETYAHSKTHFT